MSDDQKSEWARPLEIDELPKIKSQVDRKFKKPKRDTSTMGLVLPSKLSNEDKLDREYIHQIMLGAVQIDPNTIETIRNSSNINNVITAKELVDLKTIPDFITKIYWGKYYDIVKNQQKLMTKMAQSSEDLKKKAIYNFIAKHIFEAPIILKHLIRSKDPKYKQVIPTFEFYYNDILDDIRKDDTINVEEEVGEIIKRAEKESSDIKIEGFLFDPQNKKYINWGKYIDQLELRIQKFKTLMESEQDTNKKKALMYIIKNFNKGPIGIKEINERIRVSSQREKSILGFIYKIYIRFYNKFIKDLIESEFNIDTEMTDTTIDIMEELFGKD